MKRVWMITGAGRGLGRAFAEEAVKNGDQVIATVRKLNEDDELLKKENVLPVIMDVTNKDEVKAAVQKGHQKFGKIDVLINNAGFGASGAFEEISDEELRTLMETNYFGVTNVMREIIPIMRQQKSGMILTVSSQAGAMGYLGSSAYCSSKYAVAGLSEALRMELAPFGIQVASILPGSFRTDFRDTSSMKYAKNPMPEYEGTAVHATSKFLAENNHKQEGDPVKAAAFLTYCLNQEAYLRVFLRHGDVPMENNSAERAIRPFCIGKKNWIMNDTIHGAQSSAIIYSIVETAKANNLKPYEYMKYLLEELPKHMDDNHKNMDFIDDLLPWSDKLPPECRKLQQN